VAAKSGLSMRDKPDAKAAVLVKIPYGTKLTVAYPEAIVNINTEGLEGAWAKTTYNGKTGYIVNSYLLPWSPPKPTVKKMLDYFKQVSVAAGSPLIIKVGSTDSLEGDGSTTKKYLFKNGAEVHEEMFYESNNNNYFLPGLTLQQGFILLRLIPEFSDVFAANDELPASDKTFKKGEREYTIKLEKDITNGFTWINRITMDYEEGAVYHFEMFVAGGQLIIIFGGGV
jgi:hypothetical protein